MFRWISYGIISPVTKRFFDVFFSLFVLIFLSPIFLSIACFIKFSSKGPVIYSHYRLGKNGKLFKCYKFRTMVPNAEALLSELVENQIVFEEWHRYQKLKNDPRVPSWGKFLRRHSLDELPQFLNVLKGDLSVVGPRPYLPDQAKKLKKYKKSILSVKPGITGLWQTSSRNAHCFHRRVFLDLCYVKKSSFFFDLMLIFKTLKVILSPNDAY